MGKVYRKLKFHIKVSTTILKSTGQVMAKTTQPYTDQKRNMPCHELTRS